MGVLLLYMENVRLDIKYFIEICLYIFMYKNYRYGLREGELRVRLGVCICYGRRN